MPIVFKALRINNLRDAMAKIIPLLPQKTPAATVSYWTVLR